MIDYALCSSKMMLCPKTLYYYYSNENSITRRLDETRFYRQFDLCHEVERRLRSCGFDSPNLDLRLKRMVLYECVYAVHEAIYHLPCLQSMERLHIIAGHDEMDSTSSAAEVPDYTKALVEDVKGLKIGLPKEYFVEGMDPEVEQAVRTAIKKYEELGAEVVEISLPHTEYAISTYYLIAPAEAATNLERYDGVSYGERVDGEDLVQMMTNTRDEKFGEEVKRRIMIGNYALSAGYYDAYYLKALKVRTLVQQDYTEAFKKVDVIMAPTAPTPAFKIGEMIADPLQMYLQDVCTVPLNLAGLPGISIPCGKSSKGLPIGLQIIGKPLAEETLIRTAYTYEQSQDYHKQMPELGGNH